MSSITGFWDQSFLDHDPPTGELYAAASGRLAIEEPHPDRSERLENIRHILETELPREVAWADAPPATSEQIHRVHDSDYIEKLRSFCESDNRRFTPETGGNEATYTAAKHTAGAAAAAVNQPSRVRDAGNDRRGTQYREHRLGSLRVVGRRRRFRGGNDRVSRRALRTVVGFRVICSEPPRT